MRARARAKGESAAEIINSGFPARRQPRAFIGEIRGWFALGERGFALLFADYLRMRVNFFSLHLG